MIDALHDDTDKISGRTQAHAPEVDGVVYVQNSDDLEVPRAGEIFDVKIIEALDYDLIGEKLHA